MTKTAIPETVILEMQSAAYRFKKLIVDFEGRVDDARVEYNKMESGRASTVKQYRETLDFLQEHNPDACRDGDWFGEMGTTRSELLNQEQQNQLKKP